MIKAAGLLVMTGLVLIVMVALIVGVMWAVVAVPVLIGAAVAYGITSRARGRRRRPAADPRVPGNQAARTPS